MRTSTLNFDFLSKEKLKTFEKKHKTLLWFFAGYFVFMFLLKIASIFFTIGLNPTHSIAKKVVLIHRNTIPARDQIIVFKQPRQPIYPLETKFVKYLRGIPGDEVKVINNHILINNLLAGIAIDKDPSGKPYSPLQFSGIIPPHKYLVLGTAEDSFDSRYEAFGLVDEDKIIGSGIASF
jgi:conjugal transfer pilin signal peptidase TrbI